MQIAIQPVSLQGNVTAIASKSVAHRMLICAALSKNACEVVCPTTSEDIEATVACLNAMGAEIRHTASGFSVKPISQPQSGILPCGESGSTMRFLIPVVLALGCPVSLSMKGRLPYRPLSALRETVTAHGGRIGEQGKPILSVDGALTPGEYGLDASVSSQFVSGLLFALPLLSGDSCLRLTGKVESRPYIDLSLEVLKQFGISIFEEDSHTFRIPGRQVYCAPDRVSVEGDWSNAAFWLCAAAISGDPICCRGLHVTSCQGDRKIVDLLRNFGADITVQNQKITVHGGHLKGIDIDASNIPDLVPALAAVASFADGVTHITGAQRLRYKESDRLQTVAAALKALGANITMEEDGLTIIGRSYLDGGICNAAGDHRIAMMAAVAAQGCKNIVTIVGAEAVNKSYPHFFEDYESLGGKTEQSEEVS